MLMMFHLEMIYPYLEFQPNKFSTILVSKYLASVTFSYSNSAIMPCAKFHYDSFAEIWAITNPYSGKPNLGWTESSMKHSPRHQQPWSWQCKITNLLCSLMFDFNFMWWCSVEELHKMQINWHFSPEEYVCFPFFICFIFIQPMVYLVNLFMPTIIVWMMFLNCVLNVLNLLPSSAFHKIIQI